MHTKHIHVPILVHAFIYYNIMVCLLVFTLKDFNLSIVPSYIATILLTRYLESKIVINFG